MATPDGILQWLNAQPKRPTRIQVAQRYRNLLLSYWSRFGEMPPTQYLNNRILELWSIAGLEWIKREAWKAAEGTIRVHGGRVPKELTDGD